MQCCKPAIRQGELPNEPPRHMPSHFVQRGRQQCRRRHICPFSFVIPRRPLQGFSLSFKWDLQPIYRTCIARNWTFQAGGSLVKIKIVSTAFASVIFVWSNWLSRAPKASQTVTPLNSSIMIWFAFYVWGNTFAFYVWGNTLQLYVTLYTPFQLLRPNICPSALFQLTASTADHKPVPHSHNARNTALAGSERWQKCQEAQEILEISRVLFARVLNKLDLKFQNCNFGMIFSSSAEGHPLNWQKL